MHGPEKKDSFANFNIHNSQVRGQGLVSYERAMQVLRPYGVLLSSASSLDLPCASIISYTIAMRPNHCKGTVALYHRDYYSQVLDQSGQSH
jgi:hypothetical protein